MYAIAQAFLTWPSHRSVVCPPPFLLATDTRAVCPCARLLFQLAEGAARCAPLSLKPCTSLCVPCTPSLSDAPLPCLLQASTRRSRNASIACELRIQPSIPSCAIFFPSTNRQPLIHTGRVTAFRRTCLLCRPKCCCTWSVASTQTLPCPSPSPLDAHTQ
jgi:hypothetical protein